MTLTELVEELFMAACRRQIAAFADGGWEPYAEAWWEVHNGRYIRAFVTRHGNGN